MQVQIIRGLPNTQNDANDEVNEFGGGRIFHTSTDQDGNFRVGRLFNVEQVQQDPASLNTSAFRPAGLQELDTRCSWILDKVVQQLMNLVQTVRLVQTIMLFQHRRLLLLTLHPQIGGGPNSPNVNAVTAGKINITGNTIGTTDNSPITVTTGMNFNGGVSGTPVAFAYFMTSKT